MKIPTIRLKGTSGDELLEQVRDARAALRAASDALQKAAPQGRDYYVQGANSEGNSALSVAQYEHRERLRKLAEVDAELLEISVGIRDQMDERLRRRAETRARMTATTDVPTPLYGTPSVPSCRDHDVSTRGRS